jgi:phosphatidate cytidylyltransferase
MSYRDPYRQTGDWADWPDREGAGGTDPGSGESGDDSDYGRHRARHSQAAPDPYPYPEDAYQPEGHQAGRHSGDGVGGDSYAPHPYSEDPPQENRYEDSRYREDSYQDVSRYTDEYRSDNYRPEDFGAPRTETRWDSPTAAQPSVGQPPPDRTGRSSSFDGSVDFDRDPGLADSTSSFARVTDFDTSTGFDAPTGYDMSDTSSGFPATTEPAALTDGGRLGRTRAQRRQSPGEQAPPGSGPQRQRSRAGRNLPAAIGVGVILGAAVIASLVIWRPAFVFLVGVAVCVAIWELSRAIGHSGAHPPLVPLMIGGVAMCGLAWFEGPDSLAVGLLVTVLATMVWRLADGPAGYQRDIAAATLVAVYVPFLGGFAALLVAPEDGAKRVLVTIAAVVLSDTGGYVAGVFLGKHAMAPTISPKKSWEGLGGSLVATGLGGAVLLYYLFNVAPWWGVLFGLALSVAAVVGDLAESMLKRDLGVKDMSSLLPGHGGVMDRLDSVLFALPTAYLLLSVLAPVSG